MADEATMTIKAVILPEEIQKTLKDLTFSYSLADATEGWYYKLTDITNSSTDLISAETYLQFGGTAQGEDAGTAMHTVATNDNVKFLFIKHLSTRDDGTTANTADSIYLNFDDAAATNSGKDMFEIPAKQTWYCRVPSTLVGEVHVIAGQANAAGTGSGNVQCTVCAIIDDVA